MPEGAFALPVVIASVVLVDVSVVGDICPKRQTQRKEKVETVENK